MGGERWSQLRLSGCDSEVWGGVKEGSRFLAPETKRMLVPLTKVGVLFYTGCHDKIPQTGWFKQQKLTVLEV